ncbi:MAG: CRISPR-associated endonuclease Cas2 [Verrucomicrobia bacterium]|nr:CRISPR-associated endonuclease Cas2 [Verrucomicrobiota bacterium]
MYLLTYDISDDKLRTRFSKFLSRYGRRVQHSVFEIKNSERVLNNISTEIRTCFEKQFSQSDSVLVYSIGDHDCIGKFGYAKNEDSDLLVL